MGAEQERFYQEHKPALYHVASSFVASHWKYQYEPDELVNEAWLFLQQYPIVSSREIWIAAWRAMHNYHVRKRRMKRFDGYAQKRAPGACKPVSINLLDILPRLTERQLLLLALMIGNWKAKRASLATKIGVSYTTLRKDLLGITELLA